MPPITHKPTHPGVHHSNAGHRFTPQHHPTRPHPERAAVIAHLKQMHDHLNMPHVKHEPLHPTEQRMLSEGGAKLMRGVSGLGG